MSFADLNATVAVSIAALDALAKQSDATATTVTTSNANTGNSFTDLLAKISGYGVFGGAGGVANLRPEIDAATGKPTGKTLGDETGSGPFTIGDLLKQLATVIAGEKEFNQSGGAGFGLRTNVAAFEDSIQKITQLIHTWGGEAGTAFDLETFRKWLDDQQKAAAGTSAQAPTSAFPSAAAPPPFDQAAAVASAQAYKWQSIGSGQLWINTQPNDWRVHHYADLITAWKTAHGAEDDAANAEAHAKWLAGQPADDAVLVTDPTTGAQTWQSKTTGKPLTQAEAFSRAPYVSPEDRTKELQGQQEAIDTLTATEAKFKADLDSANVVLTETQARMTAMQSAALDPTTGVVTKINADMADAKDTLQYLIDKGSDAASVAAQTKVVADLQTKLDEASKQQRIATYEFEHSTAYKQQQDEIATEKADIAKKQAVYDETAVKISDAQKALDAATTKAADNATKVAADLTHSTDILRNVAATTGTKLTDAAAGIEKAGDRVLMFTNQALGALGVATTKAVTDITKAASTTANSIGAWMSKGLLP